MRMVREHRKVLLGTARSSISLLPIEKPWLDFVYDAIVEHLFQDLHAGTYKGDRSPVFRASRALARHGYGNHVYKTELRGDVTTLKNVVEKGEKPLAHAR